MNERGTNELEQRLAAMRPADPAPGVRRRIARSLERGGAPDTLGWPHRRLAVGVSIAAVIALLALAWLITFLHRPGGPDPLATPGPGQTDEDGAAGRYVREDQPPRRDGAQALNLFALNQALRHSQADAIALLDRSTPLATSGAAMPIYTAAHRSLEQTHQRGKRP